MFQSKKKTVINKRTGHKEERLLRKRETEEKYW